MEVIGTVKYQTIGIGVWSLVTKKGEAYELYNSPPEIHQDGLAVKISGEIRPDIMTVAMIGEVLEVRSWEKLAKD